MASRDTSGNVSAATPKAGLAKFPDFGAELCHFDVFDWPFSPTIGKHSTHAKCWYKEPSIAGGPKEKQRSG